MTIMRRSMQAMDHFADEYEDQGKLLGHEFVNYLYVCVTAIY